MDTCFPTPTYREISEQPVRVDFIQTHRAAASSGDSAWDRSRAEGTCFANTGFRHALSPHLAPNSPVRAAGPWFDGHDGQRLDAGDHVLESEKLPLQLRVGVILCGALLGWAVPIAIATRFL